jgi:hypothetical protein
LFKLSCHKKVVKEIRDKKDIGIYDVLGGFAEMVGRSWSESKDRTDQQHV